MLIKFTSLKLLGSIKEFSNVPKYNIYTDKFCSMWEQGIIYKQV